MDEFPTLYRQGLHTDDFGTAWRVEQMGICGIPVEWPIADLDRYEQYRWPADFAAGPPARRQYSGHRCGFSGQWYARGAWITYFEQLQQLCGMENMLMHIASEPAALFRLLDDLLAFNLRWIDKWVQMPYDGLHFADDWGDQQRLMVRPQQWRRIFKPRYAEMFRRVKQAGMHVWFHSDGRINDIFGDLIEIGVDVINSQTKVVGLEWVAANVRGKVAFRTDIDRQRVMPFASPRKSRKKCIAPSRPAARRKAASSPAAKSDPTCRWPTSGPCTRRFANMVVIEERTSRNDLPERPALTSSRRRPIAVLRDCRCKNKPVSLDCR